MIRVALVLVALLAGCAPHGTPPLQARSGAQLAPQALSGALAHHPFARVLAQYDADIATLRAAQRSAALRDADARIASGAAAMTAELARGSARVARLRMAPIERVVPPAFAPPEAFGERTLTSFEQASAQRIARAYELRAGQLREREADAAYDFERAHAGKRLIATLKLRDLHLNAQEHSKYRSQLQALDTQERELLDARRRADAATLSQYAAELRARSDSDAAELSSALASHTWATRSLPQMSALSVPPAVRRDDRSAIRTAFDQTGSDLSGRFGELRSMNADAQDALSAEIATLVRERDALRQAMVASIERR